MKRAQLTLRPLLMIILFLTFIACEDKTAQPDQSKALIGTWTESPGFAWSIRRLEFNENEYFSMFLRFDNDPKVILSGKYEVKGDSLKIFVTKQDTIKDQSITTTTVEEYSPYGKCTFKVSDDVLTINYISYPNDAPMVTQAKFVRLKK